MQIPILNGIYTNTDGDFRVSYPRNLVPISQGTGIGNQYLRPGDGILKFCDLPGLDRGGINWTDACYRVAGSRLIRVNSDSSIQDIGNIDGSDQVTMDYSFTHLAISASNNFYLYNGTTLQRVTDPDLLNVISFVFIDGYFVVTNGETMAVTELNDPFSINPLKYGSSEIDPDPIKKLLKVRNELCAINRYTIEFFDNRGGDFFPFFRVNGAQIQRGAVGTFAACVLNDKIAFVGSGRNEAIGVYLGVNSQSGKISTREIDQILASYSELELGSVCVESKVLDDQSLLYIHLPDKTLVYDESGSVMFKIPIWFILTSGLGETGVYRARNFVNCYGKWLCGDTIQNQLGYTVKNVSTHYGYKNSWEVTTSFIYNESRGGIFNSLELVALPGRVVVGENPTVSTSYSLDGQSFSQEKFIYSGKVGATEKRLVWFRQGIMRNYRTQRFKGTSDSHLSIARLEANLEPLNV